jgi:ABC-type uncharacterized transport system auxiliary subunit
MMRLLFLLPIIPLLAGCFGSAPPLPRDHYYRLLVSSPVDITVERPPAGVMRVELLQADGLLRERPLLFSESGASHEVQQHNYHYWTDAPPRMLQEQLVAYLRKSKIARAVVTPDMRVRADYQISGKVKRLERLLGGGPPRVFVELELALVRLSDNALLIVDNFADEEPEAGKGVGAAIMALNKATGRVFSRFLSRSQSAFSPMAVDLSAPGSTSSASASAP